MSDERLKIAVFIDFDNIEIGVKTTLGTYFDVGAVLEAIKERGEVVTKVAYGDWTRATDYGRSMSQHAIHMVQRNLTPGGDKNGADINLALDALEMAFTHSHINAFVIVGGDSDFITLVEKLKQYDRKVFVVGGRAFTSQVMQKNCTEFVAYEDIVGVPTRGRQADRGGRSGADGNIAGAMPLIKRALKLLADREVVPQLGLLKSTLLQLDSSFSERAYGASSFRDFVQKLAKAGHVVLKGTERSFHVELREGAEPAATEKPERHERAERPERQDRHERAEKVERGEKAERADRQEAERPEPPAEAAADADAPTAAPDAEAMPAEDAEGGPPRMGPVEGFRIIQAAFQRPGIVPRYPMYIRQVKQFVRQYDETFDERRYGFSGLVDALRYGQREGLFRLDRDRQGVVRVFPGVKLQRPGSPEAGVEEATAGHAEGATPPLPGLEPEPLDAAVAAEAAGAHAARRTDADAGEDGDVDSAVEPHVESVTYDVVTNVDAESGVIDVGRHAEDPALGAAARAGDPPVAEAAPSAPAAGGRRRRAAKAAPRPRAAKTAGTKTASGARKRPAAAAPGRRGSRKREDPSQD